MSITSHRILGGIIVGGIITLILIFNFIRNIEPEGYDKYGLSSLYIPETETPNINGVFGGMKVEQGGAIMNELGNATLK